VPTSSGRIQTWDSLLRGTGQSASRPVHGLWKSPEIGRKPQTANLRVQGRGSTGQARDSLTTDLKAHLFGLVENAVKQYCAIWHNAKPGRGLR
jgi:hypothetical protein